MSGRAGRMADTVRLTSSDGFEFVISREAAYVSNTMKSMLDAQGGGAWEGDGLELVPAQPRLRGGRRGLVDCLLLGAHDACLDRPRLGM